MRGKKFFVDMAISAKIAMLAVITGCLSVFHLYGEDLQPSSFSDMNTQQLRGVNAGSTNYSLFPEFSIPAMDSLSADNSLDENTYFIGGGDVFRIYIVDMPSMNYIGTVNQSGDLYFRSIGIISVGRVSLARAKVLIADYVASKLKDHHDIHVALIKTKVATISISGSVTSPGTYSLPGYFRIWDALKISNKEQREREQALSTSYLNEYDLRSVMVRHNNSDSVDYYDLLPFLFKGSLSQNPYIYPGDYLSLFPATNRVFIGGGIKGVLSGFIPIHPKERAKDFLSLFSFEANADSENILIKQSDDDGHSQTISFNVTQNQEVYLHNGDIITVPYKKDLSEIFVVTVSGEVVKPGLYPITKGITTARDILVMAGSYKPLANVEKAAVIRRNKLPRDLFFRQDSKSAQPEPLAAIRPELSSAFSMMNATKDFSIILIADQPETVLEPWDQIYVPRSEHMVFISGSVKHPGGYPFVPKKEKEYYINLAGGYSDRANKGNASVIALYSDVFQTCNHPYIEDGDIIVVPLSQEYKFMSIVIIPAISIILAAAGVVLGIMATTKN